MNRYTVYVPNNYTTPQLRNAKNEIVLVAPTLGGQWATMQTSEQARRLMRKVARLLNASPTIKRRAE